VGKGRARRVFLSHTSELRMYPTGRSFIAAAEEAVSRTKNSILDMEYFAARDGKPADVCRKKVADAEIFVAIAGFRYGAIVCDATDQSYVQLEFDAATQAEIPRLSFLLGEETEGPRALLHDEEFGARQSTFRRYLQKVGVTATVTSPEALAKEMMHALFELQDEDGLEQAAISKTKSTDDQPVLSARIPTKSGVMDLTFFNPIDPGSVAQLLLQLSEGSRDD
jgi:hypothetical protein